MSQIIRGFGTIFVVILAFVLCLSVNKASAETAAAKEYKRMLLRNWKTVILTQW